MVRIIADSTCDLSRELLEKYNILILPLHVHLGDKAYLQAESRRGWADECEEKVSWKDEQSASFLGCSVC